MNKLLVLLLILILSPALTTAAVKNPNTHNFAEFAKRPNDQYELSKDRTFLDKQKRIQYEIIFKDWANNSYALLEVVIWSSRTNPQCTPELNTGWALYGYEYSEGFDHWGLNKGAYGTNTIKFDALLVDLFAWMPTEWWDDAAAKNEEGYVCGGLVMSAHTFDKDPSDPDAHRPTGTGNKIYDVVMVKIFENVVDKALEGIDEQLSNPFGGTNLYWTIGIIIVIAIPIIIKYMKQNKK
ncbi:hypothetical protein LCGC14_0303050 [marine sediment metagenome]|uniref:Uncharacterized protein n=1 Tax=marine sediment metagenome TaxID=412755 RepID=A0A0F9TUM5_9ZZZZ